MENRFNPAEPGISHPIRNTAIRLLDDGRIAILAGNGCGIILDTDTGCINIYGKELNFSFDEIKIDGNTIDKELISDKRLKEFRSKEGSGHITKKLLEIQSKEED